MHTNLSTVSYMSFCVLSPIMSSCLKLNQSNLDEFLGRRSNGKNSEIYFFRINVLSISFNHHSKVIVFVVNFSHIKRIFRTDLFVSLFNHVYHKIVFP